MTAPAVRPSIPGGISLVLKFSQDGQESACVLGRGETDTTAWTQAQAQADLQGVWNALRPLVGPGTSVVGGSLRSLNTGIPFVFELAAPTNPTGGASVTGTNVAAACLLIRWSTSFGGRSGKGRTFLPGLPANWVAPGGRSLNALGLSEAGAAIPNMLNDTGIYATRSTPAVISYSDAIARQVVSGAASSIIGIQRRRMR